MATIYIPTPLRPYIDNNESVSVSGNTVGEALHDLVMRHPGLENQLFSDGKLRSFIHIFLHEQDIRFLDENDTPIAEDDVIRILPSIAGGAAFPPESFVVTENNIRLLSLDAVQQLQQESGLSRREVELAALEVGVLPRRYLRSYGTVGLEGQIKLLNSTVAVIGLGGLGGGVVEGLARMGIGRIVVVDGDTFIDHNFNRQLLSKESAVGQSKAEAAKARVAEINVSVEVIAHTTYLTQENLAEILTGVDVVVDALDRLPTRLMLQEGVQQLGIPLVHGAIAGYMGQVMTIFPEDLGLCALYGDGDVPAQGAEAELGCPAATPMMVSAWQLQEVLKILLGTGKLLRGRMLFMDAESGSVNILKVGPG